MGCRTYFKMDGNISIRHELNEEMNIPILVIPMGEYCKEHCLDLNISLFT